MKTISLAVAALMLSGCSLVWAPKYGPDANTDALDLDAGIDAYTAPDATADAYIGPDAFTPPENCDALGDEDHNGLQECDDPACFGHEGCCSAASGLPYTADFSMWPTDWNAGGSASVVDGLLRFGMSGYLVRNACVPLAEGVRLSVPIHRVSASSGLVRLVLSPAAEAGRDGFVDELAVEFGGDTIRVFRAGALQTIPTPEVGRDCAGDGVVRTPTTISLPPLAQTIALRLDVRPGVVGGRTVMLVNAFLDPGTYAGCSDPQAIVRDAAIDLRDLVTTPGTSGGCSGTPGLYVALEGKGETFEIGPDAAHRELRLTNYECASPGVFTIPSTPTLGRAAMGTVPVAVPPMLEPAAGGIGAPSLRYQSANSEWLLSFDGSEQDRASEVFAPITTRLFQSSTTLLGGAWNGRPMSRSIPLTMTSGEALAGSFREPQQSGVDLYFSALHRPAPDAGVGVDAGSWDAGVIRPAYGIFRANQLRPGEFNSAARIELTGCDDYREPVEVGREAMPFDSTLLYRCDRGASSTVGMSRLTVGSTTAALVDANILGSAYATRRVRALDALRKGDRWALWVLFDGPAGGELHLFLATAAAGTRPNFVSFAGNPVLIESELREAGTCNAGETCAMTSFTVALDDATLRFYFARHRGSAYEFVLRNQLAPPGFH